MSNIIRTGSIPTFKLHESTHAHSNSSLKSIIQDKIDVIKKTDTVKYQDLQKLYIEIKTKGFTVYPDYISEKMKPIISFTSDEIKTFINMCQKDEVNIQFTGVCIHQQRIDGNFNNGNFAFAKLVDCNFSK